MVLSISVMLTAERTTALACLLLAIVVNRNTCWWRAKCELQSYQWQQRRVFSFAFMVENIVLTIVTMLSTSPRTDDIFITRECV
jgi:hypothetical protein